MSNSLRLLCILAWLAGGFGLRAQPWDALRELKPGDRVKISDAQGRDRTGSFMAFTPDSISLETGNGSVAIQRPEVRRVQVRSNARRARNIAIGAAIGIAIGVTADQTVGAYVRNETGESGGARALTYILPAALFAAIPALLPAYRTIYRAH